MTDKEYIVTNKEQELDVLKKFGEKGLVWLSGDNSTEWVLSENSLFNSHASFPYALVENENKKIAWLAMGQLTDEEIVYDERKEEIMYKVTQELMNELIKWLDENSLETKTGYMYEAVDGDEIQRLPDVVDIWWTMPSNSIERNNRLIAIIQWLNGEDVFEVEYPHKFVVRSKHADRDGDYIYVGVDYDIFTTYRCDLNCATKFDTREEAQEWANSHQVVVEIDAEVNEVE